MLRFGLPVRPMQRSAARRRRNSLFRPWLTVLEDRITPASFTVNSFADVLSPPPGTVTLRSAIQAANLLGGSNSISLPAGTYSLSLGPMDIENNLTITGASAASTLIDAASKSRIFRVGNWTVAISKVTLERGLQRVTVPGALSAGGAILDLGVLTLTNDTITGNHAVGVTGTPGVNGANGATPGADGAPAGNGGPGGDAEGGAIYLTSGGQLMIVNCVLNGNAAVQGKGGFGGLGGNGANGGSGFGGSGGAGGNGGNSGNAYGGAVYNAGGTLVAQTSLFSSNSAGLPIYALGGGGQGGFGGVGGNGQLAAAQGGAGGSGGANGFDEGGAIFNAGGSATILATSFKGNTAIGESGGPGGGGGDGGSTVVISGGEGGRGGAGGSAGDSLGGAIGNAGTMKIDSSSFFGNQASALLAGRGGVGGLGGNSAKGGNGGNGGIGGGGVSGAIGCQKGALTITHSTVSTNSASPGAGGPGGFGGAGEGGSGSPGSAGAPGVGNGGGVVNTVRATILDTIVAGNMAPVSPDVGGEFSSLGHNLIGDGTGAPGFTAPGDQVGTTADPINPMLSAPGNYGGPTPTMVPLVGSPAIDAGDNTKAPPTDQRGLPRIVDGDRNVDNDGANIDIGAVEFQPTNVSITATGSPSSVISGGTLTYTITVSTGKGDNNVLNLALSDPLPAHTAFQSFAAPAGWILSTPAMGGTGTVTATFLSFASSAKASFTLAIKVGTLPVGSTLTNTATITTTSPQPTSSGKMATVKTTVTHGDSLAVLAGPLSVTSSVTSSSTSPVPANAPTMLVVGEVPSATVRAETLPSEEVYRSPAALGRKLHLPPDFWSEFDDGGLL
jgi:uncharacterized repeat protein (TIGR01451 family)